MNKHNKTWLKKPWSALLLSLVMAGASYGESRPSGNTGNGVFFKNGKMYDANGCEFVPNGVNNTHAWSDWDANGPALAAVDNIANMGFNSIRIVWAMDTPSGVDWQRAGKEWLLDDIIERSVQNGLIPMLSIWEGTGKNDEYIVRDAANWYVRWKNIFNKYEDTLILNIANEWGNYSQNSGSWYNTYRDAITTMRNGGLRHAIVIDGTEWAKDIGPIKQYGQSLLNHEPAKEHLVWCALLLRYRRKCEHHSQRFKLGEEQQLIAHRW